MKELPLDLLGLHYGTLRMSLSNDERCELYRCWKQGENIWKRAREVFSRKKLERWKKLQQEFFSVPWQERFQKSSIQWVERDSEKYPTPLREVPEAPLVLFYRGSWESWHWPALAVVGSRQASLYGLCEGRKLVEELVSFGVCLVSGLARGIDRMVHETVLKCRGKTVAVVGCGLDKVYPRQNQDVFRAMWERGLVVSEYFPGTPPLRHHFPWRNRLISGLSLGVFVVEGSGRSGSLTTAKWALEQGREVFALPGPVSSCNSQGPHLLIQQGAKLVASVVDIVEELFPQAVSLPLANSVKPEWLSFFQQSRSLEEIRDFLQFDLPQTWSFLLRAELDGWLLRRGGVWHLSKVYCKGKVES